MLTRGGAVRWFRVRARAGRAAARATALEAAPARSPAAAGRWRRPRWARCRRWPSSTPRCGGCRCCARRRWRRWSGRAAPRRAALLGWLFGTAWLGAGVWWLFISLHRYGGLPAWLAALAVALLCMALSLYLALAMALFARWRRGRAAGSTRCCSPRCGCWPSWRARVIFTGFPWLASGYAQVDGPLAAWRRGSASTASARWRRWLAACWRAAWHAARAARCRRCRRWRWRWPCRRCRRWSARASSAAPAATLSVSLLQGNVPQDEKFSMRARAADAGLGGAGAAARARRAGGGAGDGGAAAARAAGRAGARLLAGAARALRRARGQAALIGVPLGDYEQRLHQFGGRPVGRQPRRRRPTATTSVHLVPFGEFIPHRLSLVHRADEHPAGRLRARRR